MNTITNSRRFAVIATGEVVGIYDACRSWTKYAVITVGSDGLACFDLASVRSYFSDELEEL